MNMPPLAQPAIPTAEKALEQLALTGSQSALHYNEDKEGTI